MDNDIFIPFKFRASQIVGLSKVAVKAIETAGIVLRETQGKEIPNSIVWKNKLGVVKQKITGYGGLPVETETGVHDIVLESIGKPGVGETAYLVVRGTDQVGLNEAFIGIRIEGEPGGIERLLEAGDVSNFMRRGAIGSGAQRNRMAYGGLVVIGPLETKAIKHNLGIVPASIGVTPAGNSNVNYSVETWNNMEFTLKNQHPSFGAAFFWQVFA